MSKLITREVTQTTLSFTIYNISEGETVEKTLIIPSAVEDDEKLEKIATKSLDKNEKFLFLGKSEIIKKMYGMTKEDFIANAKELDENRKPIEE